MTVEARTHRSRRRIRTTDDGRRALTAGHALLTAVLALALGTLLNAPGLHKSAYNQPAGWQRTVALDVTGPLASVSHALLLDRPRRLLQSALGRKGEDSIDTAIVIPPPVTTTPSRSHTISGPGSSTTKPGGPSRPATPRKPAFSPSHKLRLWIAGDSLVIVPGWEIIRAAGHGGAIEPVGNGPDGHVATGLGRPDVFNWFTHVADELRRLKPNAVVLDFGGNDDHGYMTGLPKDVTLDGFGSASWKREYRRRVGGMMDEVNRAGAFVVWIGLPIVRSPSETRDFDLINAVVESEARKRAGRVAFVDTYATFASDTGGFAQYLDDASGNKILVRAPDGVHFEPAGGAIIARMVLHELNEHFDLASWRKKGKKRA